ncbi:hypothetical protein BDK92_0466 [Micromonospora pisi]|uniref:Uncharacterized protein n=1 Tax=Micromonospora pisi TaxID=589240 RepID=A0A495JD10_9ACTN|nr:hypothetical protein [Micromonospora pisi]RKR86242.1 hypothetical protein BDK92_0466 [Micromonospora pisi]
MAEDPDIALTVALAEYEHLREARRANNDQATARFNFFLVVASAATAVAGALITGGAGTATTSAVAGIGALVLLLGLTIFVRQVEFTNRARLYAVAIDSIRTYLVRRAPELGPYVVMPTLDDDGVYQGRPPGGPWLRDAVGLSGTIGLVNSALLALATGLGVRHVGAAWWLAVTCGALVLGGGASTHVWYVRRRSRASHARIRATVERRHQPADDPPVTAPPSAPRGGATSETPRVRWTP